MRDVDLFTSICAVGEDETWTDQGDRGPGLKIEPFDAAELRAIVSLRMEILSRALSFFRFAAQCRIDKSYLEVRGRIKNYRLHAAWTGRVFVVEGDECRPLKIPAKILANVELRLDALPFELDYRTEQTLRKAAVLAEDWKIDDAGLIAQIMS
ncbi:MAG TPA: hypothetical protein VGD60_05770 [Candidatus Acidoferrales bacterium]